MSQYHIRTYRYDGFADRFYLNLTKNIRQFKTMVTIKFNGKSVNAIALWDTGTTTTNISKE